MKWSEIRFLGIFFGFLLGALPLLAQDALPEKSRPDRHSGHVSDSEAMQQLMRFVEVSNPMPAGFKGTTENTITDPTHELEPFWQKLSVLDRPICSLCTNRRKRKCLYKF